MNADEVIGEISQVGHRVPLLRHVARDAASSPVEPGMTFGRRPQSRVRRVADADGRGPTGRMASQAPRLVPLRRRLRVAMGIVARHAVELFAAFFVTTTPRQRGSLKPDCIRIVRSELAARLRRAMAFGAKPDNGRAGRQGRTPDGEVGVLSRSEIRGSYSFQVISARPMASLAAYRPDPTTQGLCRSGRHANWCGGTQDSAARRRC